MKKIIIIFTSIILIILSIDLIACNYYNKKIITFLQQKETRNSDVTVVFMGDVNKNFDLGQETIKRLHHASELLKSNKTKNIICVGGKGLAKILGITGSQMMRNYLIEIGVPGEKALVDTASYDSYSNWEEAHKIIISNKWKTVTLVSSALHLYRLSVIVKDDNLVLSFSPYSFDYADSLTDLYFMREWIHHEWKAFAALKIFPEPVYRVLLGLIR